MPTSALPPSWQKNKHFGLNRFMRLSASNVLDLAEIITSDLRPDM